MQPSRLSCHEYSFAAETPHLPSQGKTTHNCRLIGQALLRSSEKKVANVKTRMILFTFLLLPGANVSAAPHYVDFSLSTNGSGSFLSPWNNLASVNNHAFATGDDVYIKCGGVSNKKEQLTVDWDGTAADPVVIGSYYSQNGAPVHDVLGQRPTIDLNKDYPCAGDIVLPSCFYTPIIRVNSRYVVVKNLIIKNSSGGGILFAGPDINYPEQQAAYGEINRVFVECTTGVSLGIDNMDHFKMVQCEFADAPTTTSRPWPSNYRIRYSNDVLVDGCVIRSSNKEGTNIAGNQRVEIKNCTYYAANRPFFNFPGYKGGEPLENINIHHNLFYGSKDYGGTLLYFGDEPVDPGGASNVRVHNNIVAAAGTGGTSGAFEYLISFNNCRDADGNKVQAVWKDILIYNNTFVEMRAAVKSVADPAYVAFENCQIKNNIFANYFYTSINFLGAESKQLFIDIDYNLWSHKPHSYLQGPNDPGYPNYSNQIVGLSKTSGWTDLLYQGVTKENFKFSGASMAINQGATLDSLYKLDYYGTARPQGAAWDIGAYEYLNPTSAPPQAPSGLSAK